MWQTTKKVDFGMLFDTIFSKKTALAGNGKLQLNTMYTMERNLQLHYQR